MRPLHRYLGNPLLTFLARAFFRAPLGDVYCGLRGMSRSAFSRLDMQSPGMEFALEMVVKAKLLGMTISEVPTTLSPSRRGRPPHLSTWADGRRSLLLYLASMPQMLLYPGLVLMVVGLALGALLVAQPISILSVHFDVHTLLVCGVSALLGFQLVSHSVILRYLMVTARLLPPQPRFMVWLGRLKLEYGLGTGAAFALVGLAGVLSIARTWEAGGFGDLDPFSTMRVAIPSVISIALGLQVALASLFLALVKWQVRSRSSG